MKKLIVFLFVLSQAICAMSQTYRALWKQVSEYESKDLPKSEMEVLSSIVEKAEQEGEYGNLLKAEMRKVQLMVLVSPDSLIPSVKRLIDKENTIQDKALKAVYCATIYKYLNSYSNLKSLGNANDYRQKALKNPKALAAVKCAEYEPFVEMGNIGKYFLNDLLSVVGYEVNDFQTLHDYYDKAGLRGATLLTALRLAADEKTKDQRAGRVSKYNKYYGSPYKLFLDSLEKRYGDLQVCGEVAIARLEFMEGCKDVKVKDEINAIHHGVNNWPDYERMNELRNAESQRIYPYFKISTNRKQRIPNKDFSFYLGSLRNISQLSLTISATSLKGDTKLSPNYEKELQQIKKAITGVAFSNTKNFYGHVNYEIFKDSVLVPGLEPGVYLVEATAPKAGTDYELLYVSDIYPVAQSLPDGKIRIAVLNATSGHPVPNAKLKLYYGYGKGQEIIDVTTDANGEVIRNKNDKYLRRLYAYTDNDVYSQESSYNSSFHLYTAQEKTERTNLYTDRSIYRPGQTVKVSVLKFSRDGDETEVLPNRRVNVSLRDANYKTIADKTVTTDEYGTASLEFVLPKNALNGRFTVMTYNASEYIRVEEYKRPTFEIIFPEITKKYQNGDTLLVHTKVKTFAGAPVQGAKVYYEIVRKKAYWWWGRDNEEEVMKEDSALTDRDGAFWVKMDMILPDAETRSFYNFEARVTATNVSGETHEGTLVVPLGYKKAMLSVNLPKLIERDSLRTMTFHMRNAAGHDVDAKVRYHFDNDMEHTCQTQQQIAIVPQLTSGEHRLVAYCEDDTLETKVIVFREDDTKPCMETKDWFWVSHSVFPRDGKPVTIQVGSSEEDLHILYSIFAMDKVIEQGSVKESNSLLNRKLSYKEEYGDGVYVTFFWVKNGIKYSHSCSISKPYPEKNIKLTWETFRDRLTPGQQEEWKLKITTPKGAASTKSQLMAVLYDKSLDELYYHGWSLSLGLNRRLPSTTWNSLSQQSLGLDASGRIGYLSSQQIEWNHFDSELFEVYQRLSRSIRVRGVAKTGVNADYAVAEPMAEMAVGTQLAVKDAGYMTAESAPAPAPNADESPKATSNAQVRENLNETAFFYPQVETDDNGIAALKFTLPESLTTWKFMGLAHTKDMCYGTLTDEVVASKDVMVQPNVPRFIRKGDEATIATTIVNTSNKNISGTAHIELIEPETNLIVWSNKKDFTLNENSTKGVSFNINTNATAISSLKNPLLICKVYAEGNGFSDGEQHYLPILPDKEMVTNTLSITQHEKGEAKVDLTKLIGKNATNSTLTIEYTNNPAWMIVQALPSIDTPTNEDVISYLRAYYSSYLGHHFIKSNPQLKGVIKAWANSSNPNTLTSKLMQNQDVKDILLNETPWVQDAETETEWMQKLVNYYDENSLNQKLNESISKIEDLQLGNGAWTWFKGMDGSYYMTLSVVENLVRLNLLTGNGENQTMINKGMKWMAKETNELVKMMKKEEKKGIKQVFPGGVILQYLYTSALAGTKLDSETKDANDYLVNLLKKDIKNRTIFEKGLTAIILQKRGETALAKEYIRSLKEYSVYTDEMGRYYDTPRAGYTWRDYKIPTEVSAIEAINCVTPEDSKTIEEMQRWLLQEKRTQFWATPLNTLDAIYAFMLNNTSSLDQKESTLISIDGKEVEFSDQSAGLGYVKTSSDYKGEKVITFNKTSDGTSWGAVYARFMQPVKDIAASSNGLTVTRTLSNVNAKRGTGLKVGDKVKVTITIKSDRDYDFVQIIDKRAACMEPVKQLSGQHWGYYISPKDCSTNYFVLMLTKGTHKIETEYYIDRAGTYQYAPITVQCAYSPDFSARSKTDILKVSE